MKVVARTIAGERGVKMKPSLQWTEADHMTMYKVM